MRYLILFSFLAIALLGCSDSGTTTTTSSSALSCYVSSATVVSNTNQVTFVLSASGGTASYGVSSVTANGYTGALYSGSASFSSSNTLTLQFSSLTYSTLQGASGTVSIYDADDSTTSCAFTVGTSTTLTSSNGLACTMTPSTTSPYLNQSLSFTIVGSGGTSPYTYSNFSPGTYGSVTSTLAAVSTTQGSVSASYSYAGTVTPSVQITDSLGNVASCSTSLVVQNSTSTIYPSSGYLACNVVLSPSAVYRGQAVNASAQVTAQGSGNVWATQLYFDSNSGLSGNFTGATSAVLYFAYPGNWPITFTIQDSAGNTSSCTGYQTVY